MRFDIYEHCSVKTVSHPRYAWRVVYTDPKTQKYKQKYFRTKIAAIEWVETDFFECMRRWLGVDHKSSFTFRDAMHYYRDLCARGRDGRPPATEHYLETIGRYESKYLKDFLWLDHPIDDTREGVCFEFMQQLRDMDTYTAAKAAQVLKAAVACSRQDRKCATNPFRDVKAPAARSKPKDQKKSNQYCPETEEVRALLSKMLEFSKSANRQIDVTSWRRVHAMASIAAMAGLRLGEIIPLRVENISLDRRRLWVREAIETGSNKRIKKPKSDAGARVVPLSSGLVRTLKSYIDELNIEGGPLFLTSTGTMMSRDNANRSFKKAAVAVGLDNLGFHGLRHFTIKQYGHMIRENRLLDHTVDV